MRIPKIIAGLALLILIAVVIRELWTDSDNAGKVKSDLMYDYASASEWLSGGNPYDPSRHLMEKHISARIQFDLDRRVVANPHTPFQIVMLAPLSLLGWVTAKNIWMMIDVVLLMLSVLMVCRELQFRMSTTGLVTLGSAVIPLANLEFFHGQISTLLLLLFVSGWIARRRGNDALCGIALGIAAALKLYPALMIIPLLRSRARRAASWLLGTLALMLVSSAFLIGSGTAIQFLDASRRNLLIWADAPANVSVASLPYRLLDSAFGFELHASIGTWITVAVGIRFTFRTFFDATGLAL